MVEVFSISSALTTTGNITMFLMVAAILTAAFISIYEYKGKLLEYITNRRNKWWFTASALFFAALVFLWTGKKLPDKYLFVLAFAYVVFVIDCFYSLQPRYFSDFQNPVLRYYEKKLYNGLVLENIGYFRQESHWYIFTTKSKLEYQMLRCLYFSELAEFDNALKALDKIQDCWLYDIEKRTAKMRRAICLIFMGNMKSALQLLGDPEKNESKNPMMWFAYSIIFENTGDMDKACEYMEKAKNIVDAGTQLPEWEKGEVYNNYARIAVIKGKNEEALRYMNLAWELIRHSKDMRIIHIVGGNRVVRMAICGRGREECENALEEYRMAVPVDSVKNHIELNNTAIILYRQLGDEEKVYNLIKDDFFVLINRLSPSEEALYVGSTFVMLMNGSFVHDWFDPYVKSNEALFAELPMLDRLTIFRAYMGIFQQVQFKELLKILPYRFLYSTIMNYYHNNAICEIDEMLATLESNSVYIYKELLTQKLGILKHLEGKEHIKKSKEIYLSLYKELYEKGLCIDAVRVLLSLLDECSSPYNIEIINPYRFGRLTYSDYINSVPPAPAPLKAQDKIHLVYSHLRVPPHTQVVPLQEDIIKEYLDTIITELKKWKHHPAKLDISIEIAHLLICMGRDEEAKDFLSFFTESGVASGQFSYWMRTEIAALKSELLK